MSDRSSKDIEREIEAERSDLDETLHELSGRFDTDYVVRQIGTQLRDNGSEIASSIQRSVKENPIALALTGIGLGWLIFGQGRDPVAERRYSSTRHTEHTEHTEPAAFVPHTTHTERAAATKPGAGPDWVYPDPDEFVTPADFDHLDDDDHHTGGPGVGDRASGAADRAKDAAGHAKDSAGRAKSSISGSAQKARSGAKARAAAARARAERMQARLSRGTEKMSAEARDRVVRARRRALEARDSASRSARRGFDKASDLYEEQPLVFGAIALAIGAALAGGLPRSRMEDRYLGEHSDALMDEAERIFREEAEKAKSVVGAAADEAQKVAEEKREAADQTARDAAPAVREEAEDAARRVRDRAKDEAERKDLGNPKT